MNDYRYLNEIYHHGVKGQRWGVRNGPPYPLKPADHSQEERKQNWARSLTTESDVVKRRVAREAEILKSKSKSARDNIKEKKEKKQAEKQAQKEKYANLHGTEKFTEFVKDHKKEIAIGAAVVAGTILVIYGTQHASEIEAMVNEAHNNRVNESVQKMFDKYKTGRANLEAAGEGFGAKNYQEVMKNFDEASGYLGKRSKAWTALDSLNNYNKSGEGIGAFSSGYAKGAQTNAVRELKALFGEDNKSVKNIDNLSRILSDGVYDHGSKMVKFEDKEFNNDEIASIKKLLDMEISKVQRIIESEQNEFKSSGKWDEAVKARNDGMAFAQKLYDLGLGNTAMANKNYTNIFTKAVGTGRDKVDAFFNKEVYIEFLKLLEEDIAMHSFEVSRWAIL